MRSEATLGTMAFDELKYRLLRRSGLTGDAAQIILEMGETGGGLTTAQVLAIIAGLPSTVTVVDNAGAPSAPAAGMSTTVSAPAGTPAGSYVYDPTTDVIYGPTTVTYQVPASAPATAQVYVSPNGDRWTVSVDNTGHLITTQES